MARRFLAPQARSGDGRGYLNSPDREYPAVADEPEVRERIREARAMRDEPEALDRDDWKRHIDRRARGLEEQRQKFETRQREDKRRRMDFEQRLSAAQEQAKRRHMNVSPDVRLLRHMQAMGKKVRHLEGRLGVLERKVWREA